MVNCLGSINHGKLDYTELTNASLVKLFENKAKLKKSLQIFTVTNKPRRIQMSLLFIPPFFGPKAALLLGPLQLFN